MTGHVRRNTQPEFFSEKALRRRAEDRRLQVECPRSYEYMDVLALLDGIRFDPPPNWPQETATAKPAPPPASPRRLKLFLASSRDLLEDRDQFDLYFRQLNDALLGQGVYLQIVRWENFLDAMVPGGLQNECDKAVREADLFVSLFGVKAAKFTVQEFDVAYQKFQSQQKPFVFTYFKNASVNLGDLNRDELHSLFDFKDRLTALGHCPTNYDSMEHLKRQFRDQLDLLLASGKLR